ncbi:hypothetical protein [Rhodopseudomonas sp. B29]|uniref:hypothetical protein n=1 Tax=Rhodopseudomonas sp. B29 TaxID=95607 RepID=UPI0003B5D916|nr:hypothetical protein [Rhodopseudomonas sp. B29]
MNATHTIATRLSSRAWPAAAAAAIPDGEALVPAEAKPVLSRSVAAFIFEMPRSAAVSKRAGRDVAQQLPDAGNIRTKILLDHFTILNRPSLPKTSESRGWIDGNLSGTELLGRPSNRIGRATDQCLGAFRWGVSEAAEETAAGPGRAGECDAEV